MALATAKSQYEQAKDGLQRAKETEVSAACHFRLCREVWYLCCV